MVKNQKQCGSCWAFSSTTSLAYRLNKLGIDANLSPQYGLSCTVRDCEAGNNYIDSQLTLIKNGTIPESCFPYASGDGTYIPQCPTECIKKTDEFKKYFTKNAYGLNPITTTEELYNVIAIIIDELTTNGPMYSGIRVYNDFRKLHEEPELCAKTIYHHNGNFENEGGHAVTLVGYGFEDDKFYWLMQNSWGENDCDGGLFKIEFGQVSAEKVSFSEPYIEDKTIITEKISLSGDNDASCHIDLKTSMDLSTWRSPLQIIFKHEYYDSFYNAFCGIHSFQNQKEIVCYYDNTNFFRGHKGKYYFYSIESLGHENEFEALNDLKQNYFLFFGADEIKSLSKGKRYYISEEGSRFSFLYQPTGIIDEPVLRPSIKKQKNLNCKLEQFNKFILGYCDIYSDDLNYFFDEDLSNSDKVISICYCYAGCYSDLIVQKLNKKIHPVFRITDFGINETETETYKKLIYIYLQI